MNALFTSWFGASWRTTLLGIVQFVAQLVYNYMQSLTPGASWDWKVFGSSAFLAILGFLSKDKEVHGGTIASGETPTAIDTAKATAIVDAAKVQ
jgi:hypothetical protein